MKRIKEELEQKLVSLNDNMEILKHEASPKAVPGTIIAASSAVREIMPVSKEDKAKLRAEIEKRNKEAQDFIAKMKTEKDERKKKEEERMKLHQERKAKETEENNKKLKEKEDELLKKKQEERKNYYNELREKRIKEMKILETAERPKIGLQDQEEYLFKKLEKKYYQEVEMPALEKKKQELAMRRNMAKPISKAELDEHDRKCRMLSEEHRKEIKQELKKRKQDEEKVLELQQKLKTGVSEKIISEEAKKKEETEKKRREKKILREKMENYANLIKEVTKALLFYCFIGNPESIVNRWCQSK